VLIGAQLNSAIANDKPLIRTIFNLPIRLFLSLSFIFYTFLPFTLPSYTATAWGQAIAAIAP